MKRFWTYRFVSLRGIFWFAKDLVVIWRVIRFKLSLKGKLENYSKRKKSAAK